nr:MAG TPA: hypothetical protein [Caudoviricetes sp.]
MGKNEKVVSAPVTWTLPGLFPFPVLRYNVS